MYDPQQDSWKILPRMPLKNSGFAAASVNSSIYIFGGQSLNGTLSNTERYDIKNETWSSDLSMPTARLGLDAVSYGNKIYVLGGKINGGKVTGTNEIFNPVIAND
jgi:N-acetylneuraminic acid mutarotase